MKLYSNVNEKLLELNEVTISIKNSKELEILRDFIEKCLQDIKNNSDFEHEHLIDYVENKNLKCNDIIIYKEKSS